MGGNISRDPSTSSSNSTNRKGSSTSSILAKKSKSTRNSKSTNASNEEKPMIKPLSNKRVIYGRTYHAMETSSYMLPRDDQEIDRLHEEHFVAKELLGFNIMSEAFKIFDFQTGDLEVLDLCCGPATWLCETSLEYPNCRFTGIDMCSLWPQVIRPINLTFTEANVLQGIPYPDKSFDFIQMRFVVLAFRKGEWPFIISEIRRVLRDGGVLQCIDMDMKIVTSDPVAKTYTEAFESFCASYGLDASAGAKLELSLKEVGGMKILQSEYREVPLGWGGPIGDAYIQLFQGTLDGLAPWLKRSLGVTDNESYDMLMNRTRHALIQSKSFMGMYALLVQKPSND